MRSNIAIQVAAPYVTIKKYAEMTGMSVRSVRNHIADGRLTIKKKNKPRETIMINVTREIIESAANLNLHLS